MPLPHSSFQQEAPQPSPITRLPSSHCSNGMPPSTLVKPPADLTASTRPLPHSSRQHVAPQSSPGTWLPSSHCS